jgi:bifunctional non-homologous end joining protein LigD
MGVVEIHTWNSTIADVERPDRLVWDLDPGPEVEWRDITAAARLVRDVLATLGLRAWVKTTGGQGLHVVAPLEPALDWSACLDFAREVSRVIVRADPQRYTMRFARHGRERRILVDYLRNNRTNTSICAYSPRARPHAPVSLPIDWSDLGRTPPRSPLPEVWRRLRRRGRDPWAEYWLHRQRIDTAAAALRRL